MVMAWMQLLSVRAWDPPKPDWHRL